MPTKIDNSDSNQNWNSGVIVDQTKTNTEIKLVTSNTAIHTRGRRNVLS